VKASLSRLVATVVLLAVAYPAHAAAGTVTNNVGIFDFQAAPGETNHLVISGTPWNGYHVTDETAPVSAGAGCASVTANEVMCPGASFVPAPRVITVALGDMDDFLRIRGGTETMRIYGGDGADDLRGGFEGVNFLDGGPGPDVFRPNTTTAVDYSQRTNPIKVIVGDGVANDGEAGEGDLILGGNLDVLGGHAGDTMTVVRSGENGVALRGRGGDDRLTVRGDWGVLSGGAGDDTLINTSRKNLSSLQGGGGNDILQGGAGKDWMQGGGGNDSLFGAGGGDTLSGRVGDDLLVGGRGKDWMGAGPGRDILRARDGGRDRLNGGSDFDRAQVDRAIDRVLEIELFF
jgi:Ca2+-binding RTX toxin-like protein